MDRYVKLLITSAIVGIALLAGIPIGFQLIAWVGGICLVIGVVGLVIHAWR